MSNEWMAGAPADAPRPVERVPSAPIGGAPPPLRPDARDEDLRALADAMPQLAWMAHADGFIFWYNRRWYEYTGTTPEQMTGWGWQRVHDPAELPRVLDRWQRSVDNGQPFAMEFPLLGADGRYRWFLTRVEPLRDAAGRVVRWLGTNTDVQTLREVREERERLLATEALARERATRLQEVTAALAATTTVAGVAEVIVGQGVAAMEAAAGTLAVVADDETLELVGARGYAPAMLQGWSRFPLGSATPLAEAARTGEPVWIESVDERARRFPEMGRAPSTGGYMSWAAIPLVAGRADARPAPLGALGLSFAASREFSPGDRVFMVSLAAQCALAVERARAFEAEHAARARQAALLDNIPDMAWVKDADGRYVAVNDAFLRTCGRAREEVIGCTDEAVWPADEAAASAAYDRLVMERGERLTFEESVRDASTGLVRALETVTTPLRDARGRVIGTTGIARDITERAELLQRERAARAEAEESNRAKAQLLSTASHELRTPLNAITGYVELLDMGLRGPITDAQREDLARIRRSAQVLTALVNDILNFARIETGHLLFHVEPVRLDVVLADVEALVAPQIRAKGLRFDHDGCGSEHGPTVVLADAERLTQVLQNLLVNAVKFTPAGGSVTLTCDEERGNQGRGVVRLRVCDTGRGIPASQLERIFEPFVQVDRHLTHTSQQGLGLGLAIARDLARRMGGDLTADSAVDVGSIFTLTLPRAQVSERR